MGHCCPTCASGLTWRYGWIASIAKVEFVHFFVGMCYFTLLILRKQDPQTLSKHPTTQTPLLLLHLL